jgi:hypothetical protein
MTAKPDSRVAGLARCSAGARPISSLMAAAAQDLPGAIVKTTAAAAGTGRRK